MKYPAIRIGVLLLILCACYALIAIGVDAFVRAEMELQLLHTAQQLPVIVAEQGTQTREMIARDVAGPLVAEIRQLRLTTDARIASIQRDANAHLSVMTTRADAQLTEANASLRYVAGVRDDVRVLLPPIQNTLDVISENADLLGRCYTVMNGAYVGNPECFANRIIPALRAVERAAVSMERMSTNSAQTTANMAAITADVRTATGRFVAPKRWYQKVGAALVVVAIGAAKIL
jgi:hypothetical protein